MKRSSEPLKETSDLPFFLPSVVDAEIKQGVLKALNLTGVRLALSFNVIYHREKNSSPLIGAFIEVLKEHRPRLARYGT